ncbi:MAG: flagellar hook-associated protein FlgK [Lachnospiraceae bacterium]|nr:flagellar hook-associated protein FlgK [Lachnospiraceae bacterium]
MANGMGSLYIGASGLQNSQNALNTTANNLANADTKGYVRQQVLFADRDYVTFKSSAISKQQAGLGVAIADVVHTRDYFLDKYYRTENGRQSFYEANYQAVMDVEDIFQELEGERYQDTLENFWDSFAELKKGPDEEVNQNLVVQKATLFLERSQAIYRNMREYQDRINLKIQNGIDRINELGHIIQNLNQEIMRIESGGVETAMTLRDERDNALDELSSLIKTDFKEDVNGAVRVKIENVEFLDEIHVFEIEGVKDDLTGFITPVWPQLSDVGWGSHIPVFNFEVDIAPELNTDIGELKGLVLSRGDKVANYRDVTGVDADRYNNGAGMSTMMAAEAELDQMVHEIVTAINDILSPTTVKSFVATDGTVYNNVRVWDEENGCVGKDGEKPGRELFVRRGCDRYTPVTVMENGESKVYYVYNEESTTDTSKMYSLQGMEINKELLEMESGLPHLDKTGQPAYEMAKALVDIWEEKKYIVNANDTNPCNFKEYYQRMIDGIGTKGKVYGGMAADLEGEVASIDNNRQQVFGVSSDEELQSMIKYQAAYNASSRFINVISEMLEHLVTRL